MQHDTSYRFAECGGTHAFATDEPPYRNACCAGNRRLCETRVDTQCSTICKWTCYVFTITPTQSIFSEIHEFAHNLLSNESEINQLFSIFVNLPIDATTFREYTKDYSTYIGDDNVDFNIQICDKTALIDDKVTKALTQIMTAFARPNKVDIYHFMSIVVNILFHIAIKCYWKGCPIQHMLIVAWFEFIVFDIWSHTTIHEIWIHCGTHTVWIIRWP